VTGQRWLARLSILAMAGAFAVLVAFAGRAGLGLLVAGFGCACAMIAGAYWFLACRGLPRWSAFALTVLAPAALIAAYVMAGLLWVACACVALAACGVATARASMGRAAGQAAAERPARRAARPFLIMNPRSGGGKVGRFGLREKARELGAEVALIEGERVDVAALAAQAVARGADLLGVAGGDGTQALVAGVAAEHDVPFLCVSAGTRNHFAMDLGLDLDDPSRCLDALADGVERRVDLGCAGGRTFVNNASFGAYAEIVRSPAYRADKTGTTLRLLPDLLKGDDRGRLAARAGDVEIDGPQAVLVSNNPYGTADIAGLGRRASLDAGTLGVIAVTVASAAQAISLIRRGRGRGLTVLSAPEVVVDGERPEIPVGIDGETVMLPAPVRCSIRPGALRVVLPRRRPGASRARRAFSWSRLGRLAAFGRLAGRPAIRT